MRYASEGFSECVKLFKPTADMSAEKLRKDLGFFWDGMGAHIGGRITDATLKDIYRLLLHRQRASIGQSEWFAEPQVFLSAAPAANGPAAPKVLLSLAAIAELVMLILCVLALKPALVIPAGVALVLTLVALIFSLVGRAQRAPAQGSVRTEPRFNVGKIVSSLEEAARGIDEAAEALFELTRESGRQGGLDGLDLAAEMLRGACEAGGELPARVSSALNLYLAQNGIERVEYSPENGALFTTLPSNGEKTLMPALMKDGTLLVKGTACVNMKEVGKA